ncbi:MAG: outer membrane lipoprotein carrier protein LolA [Bacteroidetes bacterium]|nr:outer membrane lipoprotein carrier protein LolA [Bacteroidota bacterium]
MKNFLLLLLALPLSLFAQQDAQATKILDQLSAKHKGYKTMSVDFDLLNDDATNNVHDKKSGTVKIKGDKYILNLFGVIKKCNGKNVWSIKKEEKEVEKDVVNEKSNGGLKINEIFNIYKKGYKYKYMGEKTVNGKVCLCIELYPEQGNSTQYKKITLYIDKKSKELYKLEFAEKRSSRITSILIKKLSTNANMPDLDFEYQEKRDCPTCELNDVSNAE